MSNDFRLVPDSTSEDPAPERTPVPSTVEPTERDVLSARQAVIHFKQRRRQLLEQLAQPAYINTDASCRNGMAGLAYDSEALGTRTELVRCEDTVRAEHLALLMAMEDAEQVLGGRIEFRVDSTAVVTYAAGKNHRLRDIRRRTDELLQRHPDWKLTLVKRKDNMRANALARVPFRHMNDNAAVFSVLAGSTGAKK